MKHRRGKFYVIVFMCVKIKCLKINPKKASETLMKHEMSFAFESPTSFFFLGHLWPKCSRIIKKYNVELPFKGETCFGPFVWLSAKLRVFNYISFTCAYSLMSHFCCCCPSVFKCLLTQFGPARSLTALQSCIILKDYVAWFVKVNKDIFSGNNQSCIYLPHAFAGSI